MLSKKFVIGFIPEDDRPVSLYQPYLFCQSARVNLLIPPQDLLGSRFIKAKIEDLHLWLEANFSKASAWVIALDMLIYGGLLASREWCDSQEKLEQRLTILDKLRLKHKNIKIYGFQSIKRLSGTVQKTDDLAVWQDQMNLFNPQHNRSVIKLNHQLRDRNLALNLAVINFVGKNKIDFLALLQEDTSQNDLVKKEHAALLSCIKINKVERKVILTPGTDEGGLVLLVRLINELRKKAKQKVCVIFANKRGSNRISLYEDRSIKDSLMGQMRLINAKRIKNPENADFILMLWLADEAQKDLVFEKASTNYKVANQMQRFVALIKAQLRNTVVLADLRYANGADPDFLKLLSKSINLAALKGFSAWNTTGNSLGFALAQGMLDLTDQRFLLLRLIEDWGYQSLVRAKLIDYNDKYLKFDIWNLTLDQKLILEKEMKKSFAVWQKKELSACFSEKMLKKVKVSLPWQRLFEVKVQV
ncbi:MAG: DUF4127 family protein [Candidatus Margulisiibacteriota bacterium]|jgi:hypothetical protein